VNPTLRFILLVLAITVLVLILLGAPIGIDIF
jgi:hypothetical protein